MPEQLGYQQATPEFLSYQQRWMMADEKFTEWEEERKRKELPHKIMIGVGGATGLGLISLAAACMAKYLKLTK